MKRFIRKILVFSLPVFLYAIVAMIFMPYFLSFANGPSTKQQIVHSFKNAINKSYQLVILGNSRTYRGINPDMFDYESFNFSHDNDSYNQIYYKLKFLTDNHKIIKHLILGVDYFQFSFKSDTRNYIYADFLGDEYMNDYDKSGFLEKIEYYVGNIRSQKLLHMSFSSKNKPFLRENGQYIKYGIAKKSDWVSRDINRLDFQVEYFEKILALCKSNGIMVYLTMLPTRTDELRAYTDSEIDEFNVFISSFVDHQSVFYLNYSMMDGFTLEDYTDITHFNESAANRFSKILNREIICLRAMEKGSAR